MFGNGGCEEVTVPYFGAGMQKARVPNERFEQMLKKFSTSNSHDVITLGE